MLSGGCPLLHRRGVLLTLCKDGWHHVCWLCAPRMPCSRITYTRKISATNYYIRRTWNLLARCALKLVQTAACLQ